MEQKIARGRGEPKSFIRVQGEQRTSRQGSTNEGPSMERVRKHFKGLAQNHVGASFSHA